MQLVLRSQTGRTEQPQHLADILPAVLERYGIGWTEACGEFPHGVRGARQDRLPAAMGEALPVAEFSLSLSLS